MKCKFKNCREKIFKTEFCKLHCLSENSLLKVCQDWKKLNKINPLTGRKISPGGKIFKNLENTCNVTTEVPVVNTG